ncbi:MAG: sigma 54-interacting transcriptional regulator, partial [Flavobacteriaceae bacterium]|nr:sigma 54-interacting transcriptional regulator [Flavobacteriaceae bacterium]
QKTNVRIVAATNVDMFEAIKKGKFREDLYYRLSTIDINLPPLRERKDDIHILFRKFASDFALKYKMPTLKLDEQAVQLLLKYPWNGNIRQLRNIAEQISVLERERNINATTLKGYLPNMGSNLPSVINKNKSESDFSNEREILYKVLFDMKADLNDLKKLTMELMRNGNTQKVQQENEELIQKIYKPEEEGINTPEPQEEQVKVLQIPQEATPSVYSDPDAFEYIEDITEEETLSIHEKELELIKKSLERNKGKRKLAAKELGISERTLYRKIKQFDL